MRGGNCAPKNCAARCGGARLQRAVEREVLALEVDRLHVGDDVVAQPLAQRLVAAAEEAEAQPEQRLGAKHPAVAQQDERLDERAPQRRVEEVVVALEQRRELLRHAGARRRVARRHVRHEREQRQQLLAVGRRRLLLEQLERRAEVAEPLRVLVGVAVGIALHKILELGQGRRRRGGRHGCVDALGSLCSSLGSFAET